MSTKDVDSCVFRLCRKNDKNINRIHNLKRILMKEKLEDTEYELRLARREFGWRYREYHKSVEDGSRTDVFFRAAMKADTERVWKMGKKNNNEKIEHMKKKSEVKHNREVNRNEGETRGVIYGDRELEDVDSPSGSSRNEPRIYGGANIGDKGRQLLEKDPNFMVLGKIGMIEIEVEIEKRLTKARYEWMGEGEGKENEEGDKRQSDNKNSEKEEKEITPKKINYANMRATEIPTVQRLYPPKPGSLDQETTMENIKRKMMDTARKYKEKHCDEKGNFKVIPNKKIPLCSKCALQ